MTTSKTKESRTSEKTAAEATNQAMKNYEQALRTGLRMQEEAVKWWSGIMTQAATTQDWQNRMNGAANLANEMMPLAQKGMEEALDLMEKNSRTGSDLVKKAFEAAQTPVIADSQAKWMDVFTSSLGAMRTNAEAMTQMSTRAIDSWIKFVRQNTEVTEIRVPKTA
jgi:hypothetical protein